MVEVVQEGKKIVLGRYDENITRVKKFNIGNLLANYPDATYTLLNKRPGDEAAYIVAASHCAIEGNCFLWTIHREDVAKQGKGRCELRLQRGEEVFLSYIWDTEIWESLSGTGTPPDPWETWLQELINASVDVTDAVEEAKSTLEGYVSDAESARDDAITAKNSAESANADAQTAKGIAESSGQAAAQAKQDAESAASSASSSASDASGYAERAETAASDAESAKSEAQTAAATATSKAAEASQDAEGLAEAVTAATSAAQTATAKASIATSSADSASASAINAAQSEENAADSEEAAESAASSAAASATSASSAATTATGKANEASASAATASAKASEAAQSALNAAGSATSAGTYASSAQGSASEASGSANRAETAATNAYTSATAASSAASAAQTAKTDAETAASTATTKASAAAQSATDAGTAATAAAGSAGTAATKAGEAAESATAAAGSAEDAAEALADFQEEKADLEESVINVNNALNEKQDSPSTAGTAGQVLSLDDNLDPVWTDPSADVDVSELAPVIKSSASGEIASFADGADNRVIDSLVVNVEPVQDLHGYDSPWPAGGGKNLFDLSVPVDGSGYTFANGVGTQDTSYGTGGRVIQYTGGISIPSGTTVTVSADVMISKDADNTSTIVSMGLKANGQTGGYTKNDITVGSFDTWVRISSTVETPGDKNYVGIQPRYPDHTVTFKNVQVEIGSSATSWTPYANECPISGWEGVNVVGTGRNLFDKTKTDTSNGYVANRYLSVTGGLVSDSDCNVSEYISVKPAHDYILQGVYGANVSMCFYDINKQFISGLKYNTTWGGAVKTKTFTTPDGCAYFRFSIVKTFIDETQLEPGSTPSDYEAYTGTSLPISWSSQAGVVYGGWFSILADGSVRLVNEWRKRAMADINWTYASRFESPYMTGEAAPATSGEANLYCTAYKAVPNQIASAINNMEIGFNASNMTKPYIVCKDSRYTSASDFIANLPQGAEIVFKLATPVEYILPSVEALKTLLGVNNIWADCGSIQNVAYSADTKLYIDGKLAQLAAQIVS